MEKDLQDKIRESIQKALKESSNNIQNYDIEEIPLSMIDMPIKDKGVFNMNLDNSEDESDLAKYRKSKDTQGDYESGFEGDQSVSPGYFNEEAEELPMSAIDMPIKDKGVFKLNFDSIEDSGDLDKYKRLKDIQGDYEGGFEDDQSVSPGYFNENKTIQVTQGQLQTIIKEGIQELHDQFMEQSRLEQINQQMNATSDIENWAAARESAQTQRVKQTLNWEHITKKEKIMSESTKVGEGLAFKNVDMKDVEDIMGRAASLMAEAKSNYEKLSKKG